jgi:hypothetical protein
MRSDLDLGTRLAAMAVQCVNEVLVTGERQHPERHLEQGLAATSHMKRAVRHLKKHVAGDRSEAHRKHAVVRLLMDMLCEQLAITTPDDLLDGEDQRQSVPVQREIVTGA